MKLLKYDESVWHRCCYVSLCVGEDELQTRQVTAQQNHQASLGDGGTHSDTTTTAYEDTAPIKSATEKKED